MENNEKTTNNSSQDHNMLSNLSSKIDQILSEVQYTEHNRQELIKAAEILNQQKSSKEKYKSATHSRRKSTSCIGKKHALKKYDQFALNTSCFWGSTGSNITTVVQFHEIFLTKIIRYVFNYYC